MLRPRRRRARMGSAASRRTRMSSNESVNRLMSDLPQNKFVEVATAMVAYATVPGLGRQVFYAKAASLTSVRSLT